MGRVLTYAAAAFFPRLYALLAVFLFSRILSVHDFGLFVLALAIGDFSDGAIAGWMRTAFLRFYHPGRIEELGGRLNLTPLLLMLIAGSIAAIATCWAAALILVPQNWQMVAAAASLYVTGLGGIQIALNILRGERRARLYAAIEALRPVIAISFAMAAIKYFGPTFSVCAIAMFGTQAVVGLVGGGTAWLSRTKGQDTRNWIPAMAAYGWPIFVSNVLFALMNFADRSQLQLWLGPQAVAFYAAAYSVGRQPVEVMHQAFSLGTFTELSRAYNSEGAPAAAKLLARQLALLLSVSLPSFVGLWLLGPSIIHALFDQRYWQAAPALIPIIALVGVLNGLKNYGIDQIFHMVRRTGLQVITYLPSLVITLLAGAILIPAIGLQGAALAALLGIGCSLVLSIVVTRRILVIPWPWRDLAKIVASATCMAIVLKITFGSAILTSMELAAAIAMGAATYALVMILLDFSRARSRIGGGIQALRTKVRRS